MGQAILTSTNATWPWSTTNGVTIISAELLGAGGGGGGVTNNTEGEGGGGRGGSYVRVTITRGAETTLNIVVPNTGGTAGTTGNGGAGGVASITQGGTVVALAPGGNGGLGGSGNQAYAGATAENGTEIHTGGVYYAGGNGADGNITTHLSGAGGGAAGPSAAGGAGSGATAGPRGAGTWGDGSTTRNAAGAAGVGTAESDGNTASNYGGGGSGGVARDSTNHGGGAGAPGIVVLTWNDPIALTNTNAGGTSAITGTTPGLEFVPAGKQGSGTAAAFGTAAPAGTIAIDVGLQGYAADAPVGQLGAEIELPALYGVDAISDIGGTVFRYSNLATATGDVGSLTASIDEGGGGDVTLALTAVDAGTLAEDASILAELELATTSVDSTSDVGTETLEFEIVSTGTDGIGFVGDSVAAFDLSTSGESGTSDVGSETPEFEIAATGTDATGFIGDNVAAFELATSGEPGTSDIGSAVAELELALAGADGNADIGSSAIEAEIVLGGLEATGAADAVLEVIIGQVADLVGTDAAIADVGTAAIEFELALTGTDATAAEDATVIAATVTAVDLSGVDSTSAVDALAIALDIAETGTDTAISLGTATAAIELALTGEAATSAIGDCGVDLSGTAVAATAVDAATTDVGTLDSADTVALVGASTVAQSGQVTPPAPAVSWGGPVARPPERLVVPPEPVRVSLRGVLGIVRISHVAPTVHADQTVFGLRTLAEVGTVSPIIETTIQIPIDRPEPPEPVAVRALRPKRRPRRPMVATVVAPVALPDRIDTAWLDLQRAALEDEDDLITLMAAGVFDDIA